MDINKFTVHETKNYSDFKFLDSNRQPNQILINKLVESIKENGLQIPIIVNPKFEIVDGQHRFWALQTLGYVIHYIVSKTWKNDTHTIEINNTAKRWTALDFANYASVSGNLDVRKALKLAEEWEKYTNNKLKPITALEILMEGRTHTGLLKTLKKMTYKCDLKRGLQVFNSLIQMNEYDMSASPYSQKIARTIKVMNYDYNDLNKDIIEIMCNDNFLRSYTNENDQLEYMQKKYKAAAVKYKRSKNRVNKLIISDFK